MAGIDYGTGDSTLGKLLPFNSSASAWWNPGESDWLFGGGASKNIQSKPQTYDAQQQYLQGMLGRNAPTQSTTQSDASRMQQQQLATMLQRQASGQQAGAGEMAVNRQVGQAQAAQAAQAQMARGANSALAARQAARSTADIGVAGAGQAAQAQMQDQSNAQNQLGAVLGGMRGQDIGVAGANQQAQMQQQQVQLGALQQMLGLDQAQMQALIEKAKIDSTDKGAAGGIMSGLGTMLASDENLKTEIRDAREEIDAMMTALEPVAYRYIDEAKYGEGERVGIMAQDLQKSELGKTLVADLPDGHLGIDVFKALSAVLAGIARLNERLALLER